jgi:hypothetical protein
LGVSLFFFCPHLWLMRHAMPGSLEWSRALSYLGQCAHPFRRDVEPAMRWRFLPQLVAHGLGLSPRLALAIPWLGVAALLVACGRMAGRTAAMTTRAHFEVLVIVATVSPILCSTGWLGINDAWVGLGLVTVAFSPQTGWLFAAVLLAPWVDERFWFGLPAALVIRALRSGERLARPECAAVIAAVLPYLLVRLWPFHGAPAEPAAIFLKVGTARALAALVFSPIGGWMALRFALVPLLAGWAYVHRKSGGKWALVAIGSLAAPLIFLGLFASDTSRSAGIALPWVLFGLTLPGGALRQGPGLSWLVALQLLVPTAQVTAANVAWISCLPVELYRLGHALVHY